MYGASKNVSFAHLGLICCHRNSIIKEYLLLFRKENRSKWYKMSLQNLCPEPNLSHIDQEIKNYEILKDRGAKAKVRPHSTVMSFWMGEKNLWSTLLDYFTEYFWTTFGLPLDHFWSTHLSLVLMIIASIFPWSTFGVLLDHLWVPHPSLVLITLASFLLLRAHVASHAPITRSSMPNLAFL